ncbi:sporulation protein [Kitasatospora sp. NPDC087315]|uniref:sporulation protein n=1 Tax=Kitasatospora sp. NPDC087315 TaxID=3364069 RepID=UPI0037F395DD
MVFKRLLGALGVGGPRVDTVLSTPTVRPGGQVLGRVELVGGGHDADIAGITLHLVARVEVEHDDQEGTAPAPFATAVVAGPLTLRAEERRSVEFSLPVPYEAPVTAIAGQPLHGMTVGVLTEVDVDGGRDKSDADALTIEPLPLQQQVLDAFTAAGFRFRRADLESGYIRGTGQTLPFYQEIEFAAAPQYAHACSEVELTFLSTPFQTEVVLEVDRRSGGFGHGGDVINRHVLDETAARKDLAATVDEWMRQALQRHTAHDGSHHYGSHHQDGDHRSGPGMGALVGGAVAGAAVGFVGGMIVDEVVDEVVDEFFDDED